MTSVSKNSKSLKTTQFSFKSLKNLTFLGRSPHQKVETYHVTLSPSPKLRMTFWEKPLRELKHAFRTRQNRNKNWMDSASIS